VVARESKLRKVFQQPKASRYDKARMTRYIVWSCLLAVISCTRRNPAYCTSSADCSDPAKPFCDVTGAFGPLMDDCIATPLDAGADALEDTANDAGCTPGAGILCASDMLTACAADGHSTVQTPCALGCASEPRCLTFEPSNGLGSAFIAAANEPDVVLPPGAKIDTDLGLVENAAGSALTVASELVAQSGGPSIRVFLGNSFVLDAMVIQGTAAVAFVAPGRVSVIGYVDASATEIQGGPGAVSGSDACVGLSIHAGSAIGPSFTGGAGGGGNATKGGDGAYTGNTGGQPVTTLVPFTGGCAGGDQLSSGGTIEERGGAGGGGVQLDSLDEISLTSTGLIDVGGGGGESYAGGGAGGNVLLEAPTVSIEGAVSGVTANGGAGGACGDSGPDGSASAAPAAGPSCNERSGGNGGTGTALAGNGGGTCPAGQTCVASDEGGGGGAVGRARIATATGSYTATGSPLQSAQISVTTLVTQ
jgi:hypothetical protein